MNAKCRAKHRRRLAGALLIAAWPILQYVAADDGNLTQQLHAQQNKSRFRLMLEQVQARARLRVAKGQAATTDHAGTWSPTVPGDRTSSPRLDRITLGKLATRRTDPDHGLGLQARQAYERDQQRILEHRQQRRALSAGAHPLGAVRVDSFQVKRRELVRFNAQNQRQALRHKLRP
jgi:hypothetical protein